MNQAFNQVHLHTLRKRHWIQCKGALPLEEAVCCSIVNLGLRLGLEAPVMTPAHVPFLFLPEN